MDLKGAAEILPNKKSPLVQRNIFSVPSCLLNNGGEDVVRLLRHLGFVCCHHHIY